jgi:hypothetical protein
MVVLRLPLLHLFKVYNPRDTQLARGSTRGRNPITLWTITYLIEGSSKNWLWETFRLK